jgi:hypothetical protein
MRVFIIAFMFITATLFPILFIPLWVVTVIIGLVVYPYVVTHVHWYNNQKDLDHGVKH